MAQEDELLKQAVGGDRAALTSLIEQHGPAARKAVASQIPRRWRSLLSDDDVMQQTYADAFRGIGHFVPTNNGSFAGWLITLARCNLQDAIRMLEAQKRGGDHHRMQLAKGSQSLVALSEMISSPDTTPSGHFAHAEAHSDLALAIAQLPRSYRLVIQMYDLEGRSIEDVAGALERTPGAVYMLRARAHDRLREILGRASKYFTSA